MEHDTSDLMNPREQSQWETDLVEAEMDHYNLQTEEEDNQD